MAFNHSLTLTLGCKNEKRLSGPIELDLEAAILCTNYDNKFTNSIIYVHLLDFSNNKYIFHN